MARARKDSSASPSMSGQRLMVLEEISSKKSDFLELRLVYDNRYPWVIWLTRKCKALMSTMSTAFGNFTSAEGSSTSTRMSAEEFASRFKWYSKEFMMDRMAIERNLMKIEIAHRMRIRASKMTLQHPREAHGLHVFAAILEHEWQKGAHDCSHGAPRRRSTLPSSTFS